MSANSWSPSTFRTTAEFAPLKSVLAATDFSPPLTARWLVQAISIARHYGAKLYVLNIVSSLGFNLSGAGAMAVAAGSGLARHGAAGRRSLTQQAAARGRSFRLIVRERVRLRGPRGHGATRAHRSGRRWHTWPQRPGPTLRRLGCRAGLPYILVSRTGPPGPRTPSGQHNESSASERPVLFATDFGPASLEALPRAISLANQLAKRLTLLHVLSDVPEPGDHWFTAMDVIKLRRWPESRNYRAACQADSSASGVGSKSPDYLVEFGEPLQGIVRAATCLRAGMIILGLNQKTHIETASHLPWSSAYDVVCAVQCPVLTLRNH